MQTQRDQGVMNCDQMMKKTNAETAEEKVCKQNESNATEQNKVGLLRTSVEAHDPSSKEVDDLTLRRFLRARDLDVKRASVMFLNYLKWRKDFVPNGFISPSDVANEIARNKMFAQGSDKKGRPIAVLFGARHFQNKHLDEFKRYVVGALDKLCARMPPEQEKFIVIGDLQNWGYANWDVRGYLAAISIMQDYYPERLGKLLVVHVPYIFMAAWKMVCPFIDSKTKEKIVFVENNKLKSTLLEDIDESQIPNIYGGQLPLVPVLQS